MSQKESAFVLIHGAWHGGWCWQRVVALLRNRGHLVYAPTLTGLGERSHLLSSAVDLHTHIEDVVRLVEWEDLDNIVLCGHSYGGMVVTGAAEALKGRIKALVFLDAFLPEAGRSVLAYSDPGARERLDAQIAATGQPYLPPPPAAFFAVGEKDRAWVDSKCTQHPYKTLDQGLQSVSAREGIQGKHYVRARWPNPAFDSFLIQTQQRADWATYELPFGHDLMVDAPAQVTEILLQAA